MSKLVDTTKGGHMPITSITFVFDLSLGGRGNYQLRCDLSEKVKQLYLFQDPRGDQSEPEYHGDSRTLQSAISQLQGMGLNIAEVHRRKDGKVVFTAQSGEENARAKKLFLDFTTKIGWKLATYRFPDYLVIAGMIPVSLSDKKDGKLRDWSKSEVSIF